MEGIIKNYNEQRGFGFIKMNNGKDIFFHITNWQSNELPQTNMLVSYSVAESEGKTYAFDVRCIGKRQSIVVLGNKRIKISNIKSYGISYVLVFHQKIHKSYDEISEDNEDVDWVAIRDKEHYIVPTIQHLLEPGTEYTDFEIQKDKRCVKYYDDKGNICEYTNLDSTLLDIFFSSEKNKNLINYDVKKDFRFLEVPYLYVETYQGDYYRFNQAYCNFDVLEKAKEIDSNM